MPEQNGEKTHDPTPHRREEARRKGQVAKSQDLASAVLLLAALLVLHMTATPLFEYLWQHAKSHLGGEPVLNVDVRWAVREWNVTMLALGRTLLPLLGLATLAAAFVNVMQVGFLWNPERLVPDIQRLDLLSGLQRMFSLPGLMRLIFGLFKIAVIGATAYVVLYEDFGAIMALAGEPVLKIATFTLSLMFWTTAKIGGMLLILALLDYAFQRWKHEQDLKMTHQELREELKNLQGDPQIAARRRVVQRQLAMSRMENAIPKADVVVTNPTELAVALRYDPDTMDAPIVVAKGAGVLAQRIRKLALENGIPIVEKKALAQALYRHVEVNQPIPPAEYAAVAEILAYVYELKGKKIPTPPSAA